MPDDFVDTEAAPVTATEREFDNTLSRAFDAWNGTGQAETPKGEPEETPEPETKPEKPARKLSRAERELDEKPDFGGEDEAEEQDEPAKARKADKKEGEDDDQEDRKQKAKAAKQARGNEDEEDGPKKDEKDPLEAELDKLESPKVRDWRRFKGVLKQTKSELKALQEAREADQAELQSYRAGTAAKLPPQVDEEIRGYKQQLEELQAHDAREKIRTSQHYVNNYQVPIETEHTAIINELSRLQRYSNPDDQATMDRFVDHIRRHPEELDTLEKWDSRVWKNLNKDIPDADRNRLEQAVRWVCNKHAQAKQWQTSPRAYAQMLDQHQEEQSKQFQSKYHDSLKKEEPALTKEFGQFFPYVLDNQSKEYQQKLKQIEELASKINDWSDPAAKASTDARTITKAVFADELLNLVRKQDAELKLLRKENGRFHAVRSVPAKGGGVSGRSKQGPSVDIFSDKPNFGWDSDD